MYGTLELIPPLFRLDDKMYFAGKNHHQYKKPLKIKKLSLKSG